MKPYLIGAASLLALAACTTQPDTKTAAPAAPQADVVAEIAPPPPPPPPPSMSRMAQSVMVTGAMPMNAYAEAPMPRPGMIDRENYEDVDPNPVRRVIDEPVSTFSIDEETASSAVIRRYLNSGRLPPKDAVRIEEMINYFDYPLAPPEAGAAPFATHVHIAPSPWAEGRDLMQVSIQGRDIDRTERPPMNLTLLVDVSGSMTAEDKLPLAKNALRLLLDQMGADDRIAIAVYAGAAGTVLEPTPGDQKAKILAAIDGLSAGGSTAGGEGLRLAYSLAEANAAEGRLSRVMLLTDGDFNVGINDPEELEDFVARKRETGVYLSVMGFGRGNYNDLLMQKIAQAGNGTAAYIDTLSEARKLFADEAAGALFPIADDVKIQVEFNPARVAEYRLIGYETRLLDEADFNNDAVDAGEIGAGASVTALYEITPVGGPTLIDERRYSEKGDVTATSDEIAFVKLRYKPPGEDASILIERPVTAKDRAARIGDAPETTRFAAAVAGFGQLLRGDPYLTGWDYDAAIALAEGARGEDRFGYRAEFANLVRLAKSAPALPALDAPGQPEPPPTPRPVPMPAPAPAPR